MCGASALPLPGPRTAASPEKRLTTHVIRHSGQKTQVSTHMNFPIPLFLVSLGHRRLLVSPKPIPSYFS